MLRFEVKHAGTNTATMKRLRRAAVAVRQRRPRLRAHSNITRIVEDEGSFSWSELPKASMWLLTRDWP